MTGQVGAYVLPEPMAQGYDGMQTGGAYASMGPITPAAPSAAAPTPMQPNAGGMGAGRGNMTDSLIVAVLVPGDAIARVIGKAGAGLKQIREMTGVKISVQEAGADRNAVRRVDLIGSPAGIGAAAGLVLQTASERQPSVEATILIPNKATGMVIGKGGENLKLVRERLGVRLQVERDPVGNPLTGEQERMITAHGEPSAVGAGLGLALGASSATAVKSGLGGGGGCGALALTGGIVGVAAGGTKIGSLPGIAAQGVAEVHTMPDDPEAIQVHLVIPGKLTGAVVGKAGTTIQQLAAQSGCSKLVVSTRTNSSERRVICIGGLAQVHAAQQLVHNTALHACEPSGVDASTLSQMSAIFWIPKECSGAVIGKAGATLGAIREQASVQIQFSKEEVKGMRPCTINGAIQNVMQAQALIYNLLVQENQNQAHTKRPGMMQDTADDSKRVRTSDISGGQTKLLVPARAAGAIIGRQGAGLAKIREEYGVKVDMLMQAQAPHWTEDRVVILQGPVANRQNVVQAILQAVYADEVAADLKMLVSSGEAGAIIGKQGNMLRQLREQSGVSVQVQKEEILGERLVTSSGPLMQILMASRLVMTAAMPSATS